MEKALKVSRLRKAALEVKLEAARAQQSQLLLRTTISYDNYTKKLHGRPIHAEEARYDVYHEPRPQTRSVRTATTTTTQHVNLIPIRNRRMQMDSGARFDPVDGSYTYD